MSDKKTKVLRKLEVNGLLVSPVPNSFNYTSSIAPTTVKKYAAGIGVDAIVEERNIEEGVGELNFKVFSTISNENTIVAAQNNASDNTVQATFETGDVKIFKDVAIEGKPSFGEGTENSVDISCRFGSVN